MTVYNARASTERLLEISEEVRRIASALADLSTEHGLASSVLDSTASVRVTEISAQTVQMTIRARRLRGRYFDEELFADPAWDMMLDLFAAELSEHRIAVSSLCVAAAVPATTALRWIKVLADRGLIVRRNDPLDGRRIFVELSPPASAALRRYFAELAKSTIIPIAPRSEHFAS